MTERLETNSDGKRPTQETERRLVSLTQPLASVGVLGMLLTAAFTVIDVGLRAFNASPITALNEFVSLIMAVSIIACLPAGLARRVGLDVDMLSRAMGPRTTATLRVAGHFLLLIFMALLAWRLGAAAVAEGARGQTTIILGLPTAPFLWTIAGILTLCVPVQFFVVGFEIAAKVRGAGRRTAVLWGGLAACGLVVLAFALVPKAVIAPFMPAGAAGLAIAFFALLWVLILLLVPIGPALGLTGLLGAAALLGLEPALSVLGTEAQSFLTNESLATLPLFLLMGAFAGVAGLSSDIFQLAQALFGHRRGGLAVATIGGCAGFGALTGSSLATAVVIGKVALPEMKRRGYADSLALGSVAAGGTLGQLVPPSTVLIIYAFLVEQSVGKLFIAAILPAILATLLYVLVIVIAVRLNPSLVPRAQKRDWGHILPLALRCWGVLALFGAVFGGLYGGVFTEIEAAAVGAVGAFLFALLRGRLRREVFWSVMAETTSAIALIYVLIFGAVMFSFFIGATQLPNILSNFLRAENIAPLLIVLIFVAAYLVLGTIMESFTMMVITAPVFAIAVADLGYSPIWWGIITVVCVETGMITPPFGLNLFVMKSIAPNVPLGTVYRGVMPFCAADLVRIGILIAFPSIALWLPSLM